MHTDCEPEVYTTTLSLHCIFAPVLFFVGVYTEFAGHYNDFEFVFVLVDFNPHKAKVINITSTAATIQMEPPEKYTAAEAGYRVFVMGTSAYEANLRTMYMEVISRTGRMIYLKNIASYFNYSCKVVPLFVQGSGYAETFNFQTEEDGKNINL